MLNVICAALIGVLIVLAQWLAAGQLASPPPLTVPVLLDGETALTATATGTLITGALPPGNSTALVVHITCVVVLVLQFQPVPLGALGLFVVIPVGNVSLTVIVPAVLVVPVLLTTRLYVPLWPTANVLGVAVFTILNCCVPPFVFVTVAVFAHGAVVHVVPTGGVAVTLLVMLPVAESCAVPVTAILMLAPLARNTFGKLIVLLLPVAPVPAAVVSQSALPLLTLHVQPLTVTVPGTVSLTVTPVTSLGPLFVTLIV